MGLADAHSSDDGTAGSSDSKGRSSRQSSLSPSQHTIDPLLDRTEPSVPATCQRASFFSKLTSIREKHPDWGTQLALRVLSYDEARKDCSRKDNKAFPTKASSSLTVKNPDRGTRLRSKVASVVSRSPNTTTKNRKRFGQYEEAMTKLKAAGALVKESIDEALRCGTYDQSQVDAILDRAGVDGDTQDFVISLLRGNASAGT